MKKTTRNLWAQKLAGELKIDGQKKILQKTNPGVSALLKKNYEGWVLGIDPSLRGSGFAVLEFKKDSQYPILHFSKTLSLKPNLSLAECLGEIYKLCSDCCENYPIRHVAVEETIYVNNFKIAQILGAARGAALAAATIMGRPVFEYPPLRIKQAVVGFGRAGKAQVAGMTQQILNLKKPLAFDESDASAAALCHAYTWRDEEK